MRLLLTAVLLFCLQVAMSQQLNVPVQEDELRQLVSFLASDSMKGRRAGSDENRKATAFISSYFQQLGLLPAANDSFEQKFYPDSADSLNTLSNVIALLPGRSKPDEIIVFSAHFDHLGTDRKLKRDSIFNGANDNASGTAVLMAMARYYAGWRGNERSILFCAFNGEEKGLLGSAAFTENIDPAKYVAGINLEMLGVPQIGRKKLIMTGIGKSDMVKIIGKPMKDSGIKLRGDREDNLFARSDNFSFAALGVPAHTFLSSDDGERCYHKPCDEPGRIDFTNMALLANGIIASVSEIISGAKTPSRIILR
ncbi:M28 family peptidase [Flavihumibacter solisilvae]|uniref:M28 family peptidase n=1 Tax=Flavihumibacter solisilvae TaxID=1349421 RepID=UPI00068BB6A4|nr:M28 family peptidase [Flavihumibacter solisilvae]